MRKNYAWRSKDPGFDSLQYRLGLQDFIWVHWADIGEGDVGPVEDIGRAEKKRKGSKKKNNCRDGEEFILNSQYSLIKF